MIITCPNCNKQFKIDNSLIPDDGRDLQCGSCDHVWFYKIADKIEAPLTLNENISENEIEPAIETYEKNLEFSKNLQKEKIIEPEIKNKKAKEIPNKVKKLENDDVNYLVEDNVSEDSNIRLSDNDSNLLQKSNEGSPTFETNNLYDSSYSSNENNNILEDTIPIEQSVYEIISEQVNIYITNKYRNICNILFLYFYS